MQINSFMKCLKCLVEKPAEDFYVNKKTRCKACTNEENRLWYEKNKEKRKDTISAWRSNNSEKVEQAIKQWRVNNKEHIKNIRRKHYLNNVETVKEKNKIRDKKNKEKYSVARKKWVVKNRDKVKKYVKKYRDKIKSTPQGKLFANFRVEFCKILRGKKSKKTSELLEASIFFYVKHLESEFTDGMSWDNYGIYWQVDHKIPLSAFKKTQEQLSAAYKLCNLRPIISEENRRKKDRILEEFKYLIPILKPLNIYGAADATV